MTDEGVEHEEPRISSWEFLDRAPTREDVLALLKELDPSFGIEYTAFADYVTALSQSKKAKVVDENGRKSEKRFDSWTLYMSVSGRLKMLEAAADENEWRVDFEPEPVTPTGVPGYLENSDKRLVYREYVVITTKEGRCIGRRPGTAWVPQTGGSGAAGSNPIEKVETSARGRAIAAWGVGVLPGSGIASVEEMYGMSENRQAQQEEPQEPRKSREELIEELLTVTEEARQLRDISTADAHWKVIDFARQSFGRDLLDREEDDDEGHKYPVIDWSRLKDGQLQLVINAMRQTVQRIKNEQAPV